MLAVLLPIAHSPSAPCRPGRQRHLSSTRTGRAGCSKGVFIKANMPISSYNNLVNSLPANVGWVVYPTWSYLVSVLCKVVKTCQKDPKHISITKFQNVNKDKISTKRHKDHKEMVNDYKETQKWHKIRKVPNRNSCYIATFEFIISSLCLQSHAVVAGAKWGLPLSC